MRYSTSTLRVVTLGTMALFFLLVAAEVMARRGGGRGGGGGHRMGHASHSRMGPASGGSFSSRATTRPSVTTSRPRPTSPEIRRDRPRTHSTVPPVVRHERREEIREEVHEEHWDHYHHRRHLVVVGTVYASSDFSTGYCEATVVVDNVTYYQCEEVWYKRAYSGGNVTYVVVDGPARN